MPVQIDEVEVMARDEPREAQRSAASPQPDAPDPQFATKIDHAIALLRSRDLRLRAD